MKKITVQNAAIMSATGSHTNKNAKPVICIDTGEVYTSALDAAEANGVSIHAMSKHCLGKSKKCGGKRFCYVKNVGEHLEDLTTYIMLLVQKASKYDALTAHTRELKEAEQNLVKYEEKYAALSEELQKTANLITETKTKIATLKAKPAPVVA